MLLIYGIACILIEHACIYNLQWFDLISHSWFNLQLFADIHNNKDNINIQCQWVSMYITSISDVATSTLTKFIHHRYKHKNNDDCSIRSDLKLLQLVISHSSKLILMWVTTSYCPWFKPRFKLMPNAFMLTFMRLLCLKLTSPY